MEQLEKVEKLMERANVSYEEAKEALAACDWDLLEAIIYLEKQGKTSGVARTGFAAERQETGQEQQTGEESRSFGDLLKQFGRWCVRWIEKGNRNSFCMERNAKEILCVPVTLLVVLLIFAFWIVVPLMIIGLFFDMRYHFRGPDIHSVDLNQAMDHMADAADNIKSEFADQASDDKKQG